MTADDRALMAGFLGGVPSSVETVQGWVRAAAGVFRGRMGQGWEDCVQDCLLQATRLLREGRFRGESSLKTYLWRVTSNACISRLRRRRPSAHELLEEIVPASARESPLEETLRREFGRVALEVWRNASEDCRRLWGMLLDGASYREMSEHTGVGAGALRVRVLRCRRAAWELRDTLLGGGT